MSRWLLEPDTGVYIGNPSARVRDELWDKAIKQCKETGVVLQMWTDKNPQGFSYRQFGITERQLIDFEGLCLVALKQSDTIRNSVKS